jgi:hypothetical protein
MPYGFLAIAHGAFGIYDELLLVVSVVVFVAIFGVHTALALINRKNREENPPVPPSDKADHFSLD